jgi:hypothetical protein
MAKRVKQRAAVGVLGKDLTRRSRGRCELCERREDVRAWEIPPFPELPDLESALMTCGRCRAWLEASAPVDVLEVRFLSGAVWSEVAPVRLAAGLLLRQVEGRGDPWIQEALDVLDASGWAEPEA